MSHTSLSSMTALNIVVLGESGVGKTSFVDKVIHNAQYVRYDPVGTSPFGLDHHRGSQMTLDFEDELYRLKMEDISLTPIRTLEPGLANDILDRSLRDADGVVLLYDVTDEKSYDAITEIGWEYVWSCRASANGHGWNYPTGYQRFGCVLVGNKIDLVQGDNTTKREVPQDLAEEWASMVGVRSFEVDRFDKEALEDVMRALVRNVKLANRRDNEDVQLVKDRHTAKPTTTQSLEKTETKSRKFPSLTVLKGKLPRMLSKRNTKT